MCPHPSGCCLSLHCSIGPAQNGEVGALGQTGSGAYPQQPLDLTGSARQSHHLASTWPGTLRLGNPSMRNDPHTPNVKKSVPKLPSITPAPLSSEVSRPHTPLPKPVMNTVSSNRPKPTDSRKAAKRPDLLSCRVDTALGVTARQLGMCGPAVCQANGGGG